MAILKTSVLMLNVVSLLIAFSFIFLADIPEEPFTRVMGLSVADTNLSYLNESIFGLGYLILILTLLLNIKNMIKTEEKKEQY